MLTVSKGKIKTTSDTLSSKGTPADRKLFLDSLMDSTSEHEQDYLNKQSVTNMQKVVSDMKRDEEIKAIENALSNIQSQV